MKYLILLLMVSLAVDASALITTANPVATRTQTSDVFSKKSMEKRLGRKLKFKEKAALWLLKRKMKKAWRQNPLLAVSDTTECATLTLKSGSSMQIELIKITDDQVEFRRCGEETEMSVSKYDIDKVTLANGVKIYTNIGRHKKKSHRYVDDATAKLGRKYNLASIASLVLAAVVIGAELFGLGLILLLLALIFSIVGISKSPRGKRGVGILSLILTLLLTVPFSILLILELIF